MVVSDMLCAAPVAVNVTAVCIYECTKIMKTLSLLAMSAAVALSLPATAHAQSAAADWSGAYAGFSASAISGELFATLPGTFAATNQWEDSTTIGGFAGYNWQDGNLVYGVELGVNYTIDDMMIAGAATADDFLYGLIDLRGRVGYAVDDALFYAAAGLSMMDASLNVEDADDFGYNIGFGVDYQVTETFVLGLDYTYRRIDGEITNPANPFQTENTFNTISLRAAYRF